MSRKNRRLILGAYVLMFLGLFSVIPAILSYVFAYKVNQSQGEEVWLKTQALWIMRNLTLYGILSLFAALWFIPLAFYPWDSQLWVQACMVIGIGFLAIAFLFLLNNFLKGLFKFMYSKAVF